MKKINYRKLYTNNIGEIPKGWDIHHIDFNHDNNNLDNLIAVPKMVHTVIHQSGYLNKKEIQNLIKIYNENIKSRKY
jgi:hypothetical protein|tara:strand:+ start:52 stop:282 length:231 start_codon:yes stop_codon:yes gene_type:complete